MLDEDANILVRLSGGGKGTVAISQVATGEENALRIKAYAADGAVVWDQEHPNHMGVYRYGKPKETWSRNASYVSDVSGSISRVPSGHPEGYLEAFANVYNGFIEAVRRHLDGSPMVRDEYAFPDVHEGLRGMLFIERAVDSAKAGSIWVPLE